MGMVQGIQIGAAQRARNLEPMKLIDPGQTLNALNGMRGAIRPGAVPAGGGGRIAPSVASTPSGIWGTAAVKVLTETEQWLKQERDRLALDKERLARDRIELDNAKLRAETSQAAEKHGVELAAAKEKLSQDIYNFGTGMAKKQAEADTARQGVRLKQAAEKAYMGDTTDLIRIINEGGASNANVKAIDRAPNGKDGFLITQADGKQFHMDDRKFYGWVNGFNPAVLKSIADISKGEADAATKQRELSQKDAELAEKKYKTDLENWTKTSLDPMGKPRADAGPKPKRSDYGLSETGGGMTNPPIEGAQPVKGDDGKLYWQKDGQWVLDGGKPIPVGQGPQKQEGAVSSQNTQQEKSSAIDAHAQRYVELLKSGSPKERAEFSRFIQGNQKELGYGMNEVSSRAGQMINPGKTTGKPFEAGPGQPAFMPGQETAKPEVVAPKVKEETTGAVQNGQYNDVFIPYPDGKIMKRRTYKDGGVVIVEATKTELDKIAKQPGKGKVNRQEADSGGVKTTLKPGEVVQDPGRVGGPTAGEADKGRSGEQDDEMKPTSEQGDSGDSEGGDSGDGDGGEGENKKKKNKNKKKN